MSGWIQVFIINDVAKIDTYYNLFILRLMTWHILKIGFRVDSGFNYNDVA